MVLALPESLSAVLIAPVNRALPEPGKRSSLRSYEFGQYHYPLNWKTFVYDDLLWHFICPAATGETDHIFILGNAVLSLMIFFLRFTFLKKNIFLTGHNNIQTTITLFPANSVGVWSQWKSKDKRVSSEHPCSSTNTTRPLRQECQPNTHITTLWSGQTSIESSRWGRTAFLSLLIFSFTSSCKDRKWQSETEGASFTGDGERQRGEQ